MKYYCSVCKLTWSWKQVDKRVANMYKGHWLYCPQCGGEVAQVKKEKQC